MRSKKSLLFGVTFVIFCLFLFLGNSTESFANEHSSYIFTLKDGETIAKWYIGDPVLGAEEEILTSDMIKDENTIYYITAPITSEINSFLAGLERAYLINFFTTNGGEEVTLGSQENPIELNRLQMCSPNISLTVYTSTLDVLWVEAGTIHIYGNVENLTLGTNGSSNPFGNVFIQNAMINGNVKNLTWYKDLEQSAFSFKGTCTVTGEVEIGEIKEKANLDGFGVIHPTTKTFTNIINKTIIENGYLNESIICSGVDLEEATISYEYQCYCWKGDTGNSWEKLAFADNIFLGSIYLEDFDTANLPDNANIAFYSTYGTEPVIIPKSLNKLLILNGNVVVQGSIDQVSVQWYYADATKYNVGIDLHINGNVNNMDVMGSCKMVDITVDGNITSGKRTTIPYDGDFKWLDFYKNGTEPKIMDDGKMLLMNYESIDLFGVMLPSQGELETAIGITDASIIYDESNNVIAVKTAAIDVSSNTDITNEEESAIIGSRNVTVVDSVDIAVNSFYQTQGGSTYTSDLYGIDSITNLNTPIMITVSIPVSDENVTTTFKILREHEGQIAELTDLDDNPNTVTFSTGLFSTYMIVKNNSPSNGNNTPSNGNNTQGNGNNTQGNGNNTQGNGNNSQGNGNNSQGNAPENSSNSSSNNATNSVSNTKNIKTKLDTVEKSEQPLEPLQVDYTINRGDSLSKIARIFGMTLKDLLKINPQIKNPNRLFVGQKINILINQQKEEQPLLRTIYKVQKGDTLLKICRRFNISLTDILKLNPIITNINRIKIGQSIEIKN